jgi:hypothetical protein
MARKVIWDLFGGTGAWSQPYYDNPDEYEVIIVDPRASRDPFDRRETIQDFHDRLREVGMPPRLMRPHGILAAFPCKQFAGSGSRWWKEKDERKPWLIEEAVDNARRTMECIRILKPVGFFCIENPVGRVPRLLRKELGHWAMTFNPCDYGGWLNPPGDAYTKRTCLWGRFKPPIKKPVEPVEGSKLWRIPPSPEREFLRSITPSGFARAFYEANR